jgi:hypothetical protein
MSVARFVFIAAVSMPAIAGAQQSVTDQVGSIYRYRGDTIWVERDTSVTRVVYRGDTVTKTMSLNGRLRSTQTFLLFGDSARFLEYVDSTGAKRPMPVVAMSATIAMSEHRQLELQLRMVESRRIVERSGAGQALIPPESPETPRTYAVSPAINIVQHRDTVRYITGCPAAGRLDTTVFVMFGADSTRRLTSPDRMFGEGMAVSLIGHMRLALIQAQLSTMNSSAVGALPLVRNQCVPAK